MKMMMMMMMMMMMVMIDHDHDDYILTSIKNASSKILHNFANRYTIRTKFAFCLFLRSLSWYSINRIWLIIIIMSLF